MRPGSIPWLEVANLSIASPDSIEELETVKHRIGLRRSAIIIDSEGNLSGMD